jgi:hypothetical protein
MARSAPGGRVKDQGETGGREDRGLSGARLPQGRLARGIKAMPWGGAAAPQ